MTREETIMWLDSLKKDIGQPQHQALWHYAEAIDVAIEALQDEAVHKPDYSYEADMVRRLKESLSAEAVQGEWGHMIADGSDGSHWYEYECSHCGEVVLRPYNFCPNCGTMMYKGGDDTTGGSL